MKVIVVSEEWHGFVMVAANYAAAVRQLIKTGWIYPSLCCWDEENNKYEDLSILMERANYTDMELFLTAEHDAESPLWGETFFFEEWELVE